MTIFTPYHTHFLLIREPSKFCRELRTNPPPSDPWGGTGPPHARICMGNPGFHCPATSPEEAFLSKPPQ